LVIYIEINIVVLDNFTLKTQQVVLIRVNEYKFSSYKSSLTKTFLTHVIDKET